MLLAKDPGLVFIPTANCLALVIPVTVKNPLNPEAAVPTGF